METIVIYNINWELSDMVEDWNMMNKYDNYVKKELEKDEDKA